RWVYKPGNSIWWCAIIPHQVYTNSTRTRPIYRRWLRAVDIPYIPRGWPSLRITVDIDNWLGQVRIIGYISVVKRYPVRDTSSDRVGTTDVTKTFSFSIPQITY